MRKLRKQGVKAFRIRTTLLDELALIYGVPYQEDDIQQLNEQHGEMDADAALWIYSLAGKP